MSQKTQRSAERTFRINYKPSLAIGCDTGPTKTHQSFREECDINAIVRRNAKTGFLPEIIKTNPQFGEFFDMQTYQESMNVVVFAREQFQALPALTRERFNNDPAKFLEFATDPANGPEMVKLGLAKARPQAPAPDPVPAPKSSPKKKPSAGKPEEGDGDE